MNGLRRVCEEFGGVVASIEGDGFMAVFGAKVAAEGDPSRALMAGAAAQALVAQRQTVHSDIPPLRVAVHLGEVVVAPSWEESGFSVSGDTVNVASRLCSAAQPGELLASEDVLQVTGRAGGWSEARMMAVRGRREGVLVRAFDWQSASDLATEGRWSARSTYVERPSLQAELALALETPGMTVVLGEAGAGKTRLVEHAADGRTALRVRAGSWRSPKAQDVLDALLDQAGAGVDRPLATGEEGKPQGALANVFRREAIARCLGTCGAGMIVLDDAERLPPDEVAEVAAVFQLTGMPCLLVTRRPIDDVGRVLIVSPLTRSEAELLLESMLPGPSDELREALLTRCGDSPLFLEQCARLVVENGAVLTKRGSSWIEAPERLREIPTSMRLFVSSRLDLLSASESEVLAMASVLGDRPDPSLLRHLAGDCGDALDSLVSRGLLRWDRDAASGLELSFAHALVRDVAYEAELKSRRAEVHRAAAEWYAVLPVAQVLESQAFHFEQAVVLSSSDCALVQRAVEAMVLYARAIENERTRTAREVLGRARSLVRARPECHVDMLSLELATAVTAQIAGDTTPALEAQQHALALAQARGDDAAAAEAELVLGRIHQLADAEQALAALERSFAGYVRLRDPSGQAKVLIEQSISLTHEQGLVGYVETLERAYQLANQSGDARLQATVAQLLTLHHAIATGWPQFLTWEERARHASRSDDATLTARLDLSRAILCMFDLDPKSGLIPSAAAYSAGIELGLHHVYRNAAITRLDLLILDGRLDEARALLEEARPAEVETELAWTRLQLDLLAARLHQREGDVGGAQRLLTGVGEHELISRAVLRRDLAEARAWVALETGHFALAHELARIAIGLDEDSRELPGQLRARFIGVIALCVADQRVPLGDVSQLRAVARATGMHVTADLTTRWLLVDDLRRGWEVDLHGLSPATTVEAQALDLEIRAFREQAWQYLLEAAEQWNHLGSTIWHARALLWHAEITGVEHPEAVLLLTALQAPEGLAEGLRSQVRGLAG